jgi:predicted dehydrogenase
VSPKLRWGILATGNIAQVFAEGVRLSRLGTLAAVGSRSLKTAEKFARRFNIPKAYGRYADLLKDPQVDAVYIATPHPSHAEWSVKAARAGKHILCEKPIGMNLSETQRMVEAARKNGVFLMEAFMYRCHPQTDKLLELIRRNAIGKIHLIQASFGFEAPVDLKNRLFSRKLGGGGILDVGCYPVSIARLVAGAMSGKLFADPVEVRGTGRVGKESDVDEYAMAVLQFPGGVTAEISCGIRALQENNVILHGSKGSLQVTDPWLPSWQGGFSKILLQKNGERLQKINVRSPEGLYSREADHVAACLRQGLTQSPAMNWNDSLGNMRVLDLWRKALS